MQSMTYVDAAASVGAVAAGAGLLYARASARAAREAAGAARRSLEIAERSRQAAARARLRLRVERVGQLVQEIASTAHAPSGSDEMAPTSLAQCQVLGRAVIGLNDILPKSVALSQASAASELGDRAAVASAEIDGVLKKLNSHRSRSTYRPRHVVPWHRPAGVRSAVAASARGHTTVRHQQSP